MRITKPGGKVIIWVPSIYPYHGKKAHYPDLHRFFHDTLELMAKNYSNKRLVKSGGYFKAMVNFLPFSVKIRKLFNFPDILLDRIFQSEKRNITMGYYLFITK